MPSVTANSASRSSAYDDASLDMSDQVSSAVDNRLPSYSRQRTRQKLIVCSIILSILIIAGLIVAVIFLTTNDEDNTSDKPTSVPSLTPSTSPSTLAPSVSPSISELPTSSLPPETSISLIPTRNPATMGPTSTFFKQVAQAIAPLYPDSTLPLRNPESAQSKALIWMIFNDPMPPENQSNKLQRYYIAVLYFSLEANTWHNKASWMSALSVCSWYGIKCDRNDTVIELIFSKNAVQGEIPREIALLSSLQNITMDQNEIGGTLPPSINLLHEVLLHFSVWSNDISGSIPSEYGDLPLLEILYLDHNSLEGTIPMEFYDLSSLRDFTLGYNKMQGTLSLNLRKLHNLERFWISNNKFTGNLPELNQIMPKLNYFYIDSNNFVGTIPNGLIHAFPNARDIRMSNNRLEECIPLTMFRLKQLKTLYLDHNEFSCELDSIVYESPKLVDLQLQNNRLFGSLPDLRKNSKLEILDLSNNQFDSRIPQQLQFFTSLKLLSISNNGFHGPIPSTVWHSITQIEILRFDENYFSGSIPNQIGDLHSLRELLLQDNNLRGTMPSEICSTQEITKAAITADCDGESPLISCSCCSNCEAISEGRI